MLVAFFYGKRLDHLSIRGHPMASHLNTFLSSRFTL